MKFVYSSKTASCQPKSVVPKKSSTKKVFAIFNRSEKCQKN